MPTVSGRALRVCLVGLIAGALPAPLASQGLLLDRERKDAGEPASWQVRIEPAEAPRGGRAEIVAKYKVEPGWWIYAPDHKADTGKATEVRAESPAIAIAGKPTFGEPEVKRELGEVHRVLKKEGEIRLPFTVKPDTPPAELKLPVTIEYMPCNDEGCRLPPALTLEAAFRVTDGPPAPPAAVAVPAAKNEAADAGLLAFILLMIGGGLLTLVMPCTYPMIPITISFFTKQAEARQGSVLPLALAYGAGIVLIFIVIGVAFAAPIQDFATDPYVNLAFGLAFIVFALALFGIIDLRLPASFSNIAPRAGGSGGYVGVFLLGAILVVTSFTCTAPILGSLLLVAIQGGDAGRVALGMAVFGATVAAPFVLLSLFPAKVRSLPRSGEWMHVVKVSLGFLELVAALKFLSNWEAVLWKEYLPRELFLLIWAAIFFVMGLYLLSVFRLRGEEAHGIGGVRMLFGLGAVLFALYFLHGSRGFRLDWITETMAPPYSVAAAGGAPGKAVQVVSWTLVEDDLDAGLARAKAEGKRALINFTGHT